jgi:hypothetical protein
MDEEKGIYRKYFCCYVHSTPVSFLKLPFLHSFHTGSGFTQPPIQSVLELLPRGGERARSVKLTTHVNLVPSLKMRGFIVPFGNKPS